VWKSTGELYLGASGPSGLEVLRVVGPGRVEGDLTITSNAQLLVADSATKPPLNITERSAAPSGPVAGDIYLDDGTNTASGNPGWRRYTGAVWEDISAGAGGGSSPWTDGGTVLYPTSDEDVAIGDTAVSGNERLLVVNKNVATGSHVAVIGAVTTPGVAGTVTSWVGVQAAAQVGNDTITDAKFLHVASPAGTGGITTATGLHIDDIDGGGPTVGTPFGIYQAGTSDVNAFLGKMALGASAMVGTERLRVVGDIRVESLLYLPSLTSTIVVGASAGSGSGENIRTVSDTNSGNNIGIRADFNDTSGVSLGFTGFNARMQGATGFSGTFVGFGVDPSGGGAGWSHIGFEFPDMAGTNLQGSEAFVQSGATESSRFEGRVGVGMNYRSSTTLQVGVPSNGFTTPWKSVVIAREGDNTTSSPGSSSDWYGMEVSLTQNSGGAASARYIQNLRYVNTVAPTAPVTRPLTIQNAYGLYINDWTGGANVSFTNTPYGIYQAGSSDRNYFAGQIGVGTSAPSSSAAIEISSTTRALVVSQMTSTERDALAAVLGMIIYNTTTGKYEGCTAAGTPGTWAAFH
jgi:hypothetical protein